MSNSLSIAAVTLTLKELLRRAVDPVTVTTLPLDKAATEITNEGVNLFLYQVTTNAAYRNLDEPPPGNGLRNLPPALALNLHYMLTVYGDSELDESDQQLLGKAMQALHSYSILPAEFVAESTSSLLGTNQYDLHEQQEHIRITQENVSLEEISRLWTAFQAEFRTSVMYLGSVVLIDNQRKSTQAPPVLKRGDFDRGVFVGVGAPPVLSRLEYRDVRTRQPSLPAASRGEGLTISGSNLQVGGDLVVFAFESNQRIEIDRYPDYSRDGQRLYLDQITEKDSWRCGQLALGIEYTNSRDLRSVSATIPFALAPQILISGGGPSVLVTTEEDKRLLIVQLEYPMREGSDAFLILNRVANGNGSTGFGPLRNIAKSPMSTSKSPVFDISEVTQGRYRLQVRVDGIDSLLVLRDGQSFQFDQRQEVEL